MTHRFIARKIDEKREKERGRDEEARIESSSSLAKRAMKDPTILKVFEKDKFFLQACGCLGIVPDDLLRPRRRLVSPCSSPKIARYVDRARRKKRYELLSRALEEMSRLRENARADALEKEASVASQEKMKGSGDLIDDSLEEAKARKRQKKQSERKLRLRIQRAKEKRQKLHAVVCRQHALRLEDIRAKRAAHERLKNDVVRERKKINESRAKRAERMSRRCENDIERRADALRQTFAEREMRLEERERRLREERNSIRSPARTVLARVGKICARVRQMDLDKTLSLEQKLQLTLARHATANVRRDTQADVLLARKTIHSEDATADAKRRRLKREAEIARNLRGLH